MRVFPGSSRVKHPADREAGFPELPPGNTGAVTDPWLDAVADLRTEMDAALREDAYEVFLAEAARCRLLDRVGVARILLRSGVVIDGLLTAEEEPALEGHLTVRTPAGREVLVLLAAVVTITGTSPGLRPEAESAARALAAPRITARLREAWRSGEQVRALTSRGVWLTGVVTHVGADHVDVDVDGSCVTVALQSADAWELG